MRKIRVAIYIRVSTKKQVEEGYSLEAQRERLVKICETNGYIIYKVYADEGKSGKDTNRPAFKEMMKDMEDGLFDKILVMKLDRISRSVIDLEVMIKDMQRNKVDFESASEKIDTSSSFGMMFVRLLAIFAQFERERIAERVNDTFADMVQNNRPITGVQPTGYKIETDEKGNKTIVFDEEKKDLINDLFDWYEECHSLRRTALYINEKYNTQYGTTFVSRITKQPQYYGLYKDNENYYPPYLTKERWERIQEIRKNTSVKVYSTRRYYLFASLLIDKNCGNKLGGSMTRNQKVPSHYYRCRKNLSTNTCNCNRTVNEIYLEKILLDNLDNLINDYFDKEKDTYTEEVTKKDNSQKIAALKEELKRTNLLFTKGRIEEKDYDKEYLRLENEIKKLSTQPSNKTTKRLKELSETNWKEIYTGLSKENKQIWWRSFISEIVIDPFNYKKGMDYIEVKFL